MRKAVLVLFVLTSVALSYNTVLGNRGTFGVYSGACENMGMLTIDLNAFGSMINIDSTVVPDTTRTSAQLTEIKPYIGLSFTPWRYLEFSLWSRGRYATFGRYSSSIGDLYDNLGMSVKGGVPIYFNSKRTSYFAPGIDGFAYMDGVGSNVFGFGGRALLSLKAEWFGAHLNGGYEYITLGAGTSNLLGGLGLEFWPFPWGALILETTAKVPQANMANFINYIHATPGIRLAFGNHRVVKFNINLGVDVEPMQTPLRWSALAGMGLGFDLMPLDGRYIAGVVVDKATQEPIVGAKVFIEDYPDIEPYITDEDGRFSIASPEGDYFLAAEHPDYLSIKTESQLIQAEGGAVMLEMPSLHGGAIVLGKVVDAVTGNPLRSTITFEAIDSDTLLPSFVSDGISGYYRAEVPPGTYKININADGYAKTHKSLKLEKADEVVVDFKLEPAAVVKSDKPLPKEPVALSFPSVYFGKGQSGLTVEQKSQLLEVAKKLKDNPNVKLELHGYTDSVGKAATNRRLSVRRAGVIKNYLVENGIDAARISIIGHGESHPRGDNRTRRGRNMNRRVDIVAI